MESRNNDLNEEPRLNSGRQMLRASSKNLHSSWMFTDANTADSGRRRSVRLTKIDDGDSDHSGSDKDLRRAEGDREIDKLLEDPAGELLQADPDKETSKEIDGDKPYERTVKVLITGNQHAGKNMLF